jgi:cathepsin B
MAVSAYAIYRTMHTSEEAKYQNHLNSLSSRINSANTSWKSNSNARFDGETFTSIKRFFMDEKYTKPWPLSKGNKKIHNLSGLEVPDNFDSRENWPNCDSLKEIRDQSTCGSCWAFGAAAAMSDRECIASNGTSQRRVSSEDLLTCCGSSCGDGCNGGWPEAAWDFYQGSGLVSGDGYGDNQWCRPYFFPECAHHIPATPDMPACDGEHPTPTCVRSCVSQYTANDYSDDKRRGTDVYTLDSPEQMQAELMKNGPIEVAFTVYEDFLTYQSGVYRHTEGSMLGGHAVKIIGWGVEDGINHWIVANSWNEGWGDHGTFKIVRGENHCGIEDEAVAGDAFTA